MARVSVNIESMENTLKTLSMERDELEKSLQVSKNHIDESKEYYDTPSGEYFRNIVEEYSDKELYYLKNSMKTSVEALSQIIKLYREEKEKEEKLISKLSGGER